MVTKKKTTKSAASGTKAEGPVSLGNHESYASRPRRKPDSTTKGKLNEWDNGYKEFVPVGTKPSNRNMLKQIGNSSFYKSEGEKESSFSIHINVPGDSADPVSEGLDIFKVLTEGQWKTAPKLHEGAEGRMLYDDGQGLQVWLDSEHGKVSILTQLDCDSNIERMLLQAQATMNVTIARYRQDIISHKINK